MSNAIAVTTPVFVVGLLRYRAADLVRMRDKGVRARVRVIGALSLARDVTPDLAESVIESVQVTGAVRGRQDVRARLGLDRPSGSRS